MINKVLNEKTVGERHHELEIETLKEKMIGKKIKEIIDEDRFGITIILDDDTKYKVRKGWLRV
jgi:hypothetical protein